MARQRIYAGCTSLPAPITPIAWTRNRRAGRYVLPRSFNSLLQAHHARPLRPLHTGRHPSGMLIAGRSSRHHSVIRRAVGLRYAVPIPPARRCAGRASASLPRTRCPLRFSVLLDSSHNLARSADSLHLAHSQRVARSLVRPSHKARAPSIRLRCAHRRCTPRRRSHETRDVSIVPLPLGERMLCGERVGCVLSDAP